MLFVTIRRGIRFEWQGGEYIDAFSSEPQYPGQEQSLWITNERKRPPGWYQTDITINVWDTKKGKPEIPITHAAFEKAVLDWIYKN